MRKIYTLLWLVMVVPVLLSASAVIDDETIDDQYQKNMTMAPGWVTDTYTFHATQKGSYTITVSATKKKIKMKAGDTSGSQSFFRDADGNKKNRSATFHVEANQDVYLTVWKERGNSLQYDLNIKFTPDNSTQSGSVTQSDTITLSGTLRDFHDYSKYPDKNPDFENPARVPGWNRDPVLNQGNYAVVGLVNDTLTNGVPTLANNGFGTVDTTNVLVAGTLHSITDAASFSQWFKDVDGINQSMP
ncbi:MAG: hypothetical protein DSZ05_05640, partial [Sulfurospirillum sp.]